MRRAAALALLVAGAALVTWQCDLVVPPEPITYNFDVSPDSQNLAIGDTSSPFTGTLTANGVAVAFRLGVDEDPGGIVTVTPDRRLYVRARGRTVLTVRPISTALTDSTLREQVIVYGAVPRIGLRGGQAAVDTLKSLGETFTITAAALTNRGDTIRNVPLTFELTGGSPAITLEDAATGVVRAVQDGSATVQVSVDGVIASRTVQVKQLATQLATPDTIRLGAVGQTRAVADTIRDARANLVAGVEPTWESLNNGIASVSASGVVTAVAGGTTRIVARYQPYQGPPIADTTTVIVTQAGLQDVAGDGQTGTVGASLASDFTVRLVDPANGNAALSYSGVPVTFTVTQGGGRFGTQTSVTDTTNTSGRVSIRLTLGSTVGENRVVATGAGFAAVADSVTFTATGGPAEPYDLELSSGNAQTDTVGRGLPQNFIVTVRDTFRNRVPGAAVFWDVTQGAGGVSNDVVASRDTLTVSADTLGFARARLTLDTVVGTNTVTATFPGSANTITFTASGVAGVPTRLRFGQQPSSIVAGSNFPAAPTVRWLDRYNNLTVGLSAAIDVAANTGAAGAVVVGTNFRDAVGGVSTFPGLSVSKVGSGYRLVARQVTGPTTVDTVAPDTSNAFDVTAGAVDHLGFVVQPSNSARNTTITPAVTVCLLDALGNTVTSNDGRDISLTIGTVPTGGTNILNGTTTLATVAGCATFDDIAISTNAVGYRLRASSPGTPSVTAVLSNSFSVGLFVPDHLAIVSGNNQNAIVSTALDSFIVDVRDAFENGVNGDTVIFKVQDSDASFAGTDSLLVIAANGRASARLTAGTAPGNYAVRVYSKRLGTGAAVTFAFSVSAADLFLEFVTEPGGISGGATFDPAVQVRVRDESGTTVTGASPIVTLAIVTGTGANGASIVGSASGVPVSGVATFTGLGIDKAGTGYRLAASASGLTPDTSAVFAVSVGPATQLRFVQQPLTVTAGAPFSLAPRVAVTDAGGNVVTSATDSVYLVFLTTTVPVGSNLRGATRAQAAGGVATFAGVSVDSAGSGYRLKADPPAGSSLSSAESDAFTVVPAPAVALAFRSAPASGTVDDAIAIQVAVRDSLGNVVTTTNPSITVSIAAGTGTSGAQLSGVRTVQATNGVASFADLRVTRPGTAYRLEASAGGLPNAPSATFDRAHGAATNLNYVSQPTTVAPGAVITPAVQVELRDQFGNRTTGDNASTVTLQLGPVDRGVSLGGTAARTVSAGVATFEDLTVGTEGSSYFLIAGRSGLTGQASTSFNVLASAALRLRFTTDVGCCATAGARFDSVRVSVTDGVGVVQTGTTGNVTLALTPGSGTAGAHLRGTLTRPVVNGVTAFGDLSIDSVGIQFTLTAAHDGAVAQAVSNPVTISPAPIARAEFRVQPTSRTAGTAFVPALEVVARDSLGNINNLTSDNVVLSITSGTGTSGATLSGTTVVPLSNGVATFSDVAIARAGADYTLTATVAGVTAVSQPFSMAVGTLARVVVTPGGVTLTSLGQTQQLSAVGVDEAGNAIAGLSFTWQSLNDNVATVTSTGLVRAVGNGQVAIRATTQSNFRGHALVTVAAPGAAAPTVWKVDTLQLGQDLRAVWSGSFQHAVAVGQASRIFRLEGRDTWVQHSGGDPSLTLNAVWGTNPNEVYAVGDGGQVLYYTSGTTWSTSNTGLGAVTWRGVWGSAPDDVYLVGDGGVIAHGGGGTPWTQVQHGLGDPQLRAVWGSSASDVWAVGTTVLHFDGSTWTDLGNPSAPFVLNGVWGTSPTEVYIVPEASNGAVRRWDGSQWQVLQRGDPYFPSAVHGTSGSDLYVTVNSTPEPVARFDGSQWSRLPAGVPGNFDKTAHGVFAMPTHVFVAMTDGVARGIRGGRVAIPDGPRTLTSLGEALELDARALDADDEEVPGVVMTWTSSDEAVATVDANGLVTAVANGSVNIIATGRGGAADTVEIVVAQEVATFTVTPAGLALAGGTGNLEADARDARGNPFVRTALTWSSLNPEVAAMASATGSTVTVNPVASGQATIRVVAGNDTAYALVTVALPGAAAANVWIDIATGLFENTRALGVWAASPQYVFAVGDNSYVRRFDGSAPSDYYSAAIPVSEQLNDVFGFSAGDLFVAGSRKTLLRLNQLDPPTWTTLEHGSGADMEYRKLWGSSPSDVWFLDGNGGIRHFDGATVTLASGTPIFAQSLWGSARDNIFAVGRGGVVLRYNGTSWSEMTSATGNDLADVWGAGPSEVFAVGAGGTIVRYNGSGWTLMTSGTNSDLISVWGSSGSDVYAAGSDVLLRFDGSEWRVLPGMSPFGYAISGAPGGDVYIATTTGVLRGYRGATVAIAPDATTLTALGATQQLTATARDAANNAISGVPFTWTSSDATKVTVNASGLVTAVANGTAQIIAAAPGAVDTITVTVSQAPVLSLQPGGSTTASVDASLTTPPSVRVTDPNGNPIVGATVTFSVVGGGGSATGLTPTTNADGAATVGSWTMGPTPTTNTLRAAVNDSVLNITVPATWARGVKAGHAVACAVNSGQSVLCWGDNSAFYPYGSTVSSSTTPVTTTVPAITQIANGTGLHSCGLTSTGDAVCWGRNNNGELGGGTVGGYAPVTVVGGISWAQLSTNRLNTCGVATTGTAYCWGSNQLGEIGNSSVAIGTSSQNSSPVAVEGGLTFTSVAAGWLHACGITTSGAAYCWGDNRVGALGSGTSGDTARAPRLVAGGHTFVQLAAGSRHTCGITTANEALCWGFNGAGQLGDGTTTQRDVPTVVLGGHQFTSIAVNSGGSAGTSYGGQQLGDGYTCALTAAGVPYCWGYNEFGQLGNGTTTSSSVPVAVSGGLQLNGLTLGQEFTCGMRGQQIWCWGWNDQGQLGIGTTLNSSTPVQVSGGQTFQSLAVGSVHSCALAGSSAYCWGAGSSGQLGNGSSNRALAPTAVLSGVALQAVSTGVAHSCGLTAAGAAYCWGANGTSQLGDGTTTSSTTPVAVTGGLTFQSIAAANGYTCGLTSDGTAYCWGVNNAGQLGDSSTTTRSSPVRVAGGLTFQSLSATATNSSHTCGVSGGAAYCWGNGGNGRLGDGGTANSSVPVLVSGGLTFASVSPASLHTCGLTTGGVAYCWGAGIYALGNGSLTQRNTPWPVSGGLTFASLRTGSQASCGVATDGSGYCWGTSTSLGDGINTTSAVPVAVSGGQTFQVIIPNSSFICGLTTGGSAYCWGANREGYLGNNPQFALPARVTGF